VPFAQSFAVPVVASSFSRSKCCHPFFCPPTAVSSPAGVDLNAFSNVLAGPYQRSISDAHSKAVAVLADEDSSAHDQLAALSEVAAAAAAAAKVSTLGTRFLSPLLETPSHIELVGELVRWANALADGEDRGCNGRHCRTVIGEPGIGKTTLLQAFTYGCNAAFPTIIPVYITCKDLGERSCFQDLNLRRVMIAAARAHGIEVDESLGAKALVAALVAAGRQMFVILDEFDELYRINPTEDNTLPTVRQNVMNTLWYLSWLGDQKTGRFRVVLCSSSDSAFWLVCGGEKSLFDRFPLLKGGVPDLNYTKYRDLLITSVPCNDSKQVFGIINKLKMWPDATEDERFQMARLLTFLSGATPRGLESAVGFNNNKGNGGVSAGRIQELVNDQLPGTCMLSIAGRHAGSASALFRMILRLLERANARLLERLRAEDGSCGLEEVVRKDADVTTTAGAAVPPPWEQLVCPVPYLDVERDWREVAEGENFESLLGMLTDAGLVSVRRDDNTCVRYMWPSSAAQLVYGHKDSVTLSMMEDVVRRLPLGTDGTSKIDG
jgi:AAA domain